MQGITMQQEHSMQKNGEDIKMFLSYIAIEDILCFLIRFTVAGWI